MQLKKFLNTVLPHEIFFNMFLLVLTARLFLHTGLSFFTVFFGAMVVFAVLWAWYFRAKQTPRLLIYMVLMNIVFSLLEYASPLINTAKADTLLQSWDSALIGGNISLYLQAYMSKPLTEVMAFCYSLFMVQLFVSLFYYLLVDKKHAKIFYVGLFSLYAFGFLGYIFYPAVGPYMAMAGDFTKPVEGFFITDFLHYSYPKGTNYTDVFPSLHCAISCFILFFDFQYNKKRFWWYLVPCVGLWFSTVYLRYHYFVDCLSGFALAAVMLLFTKFYADKIYREEV